MILVDLKSLISNLNLYCTRALETAAGQCLSRTHYEITVEHYLAALLGDLNADIPLILRSLEVDVAMVQRGIERSLEQFPSGNSSKPVFAPPLLELVQDAWLISSVNLLEKQIRSGAIFAAFLARLTFFGSGPYLDRLRELNRDAITNQFGALTQGSVETSVKAAHAGAEAGEEADGSDGSALGRFCVDFTAKAAAGDIDPVFGRDLEIRQMVDILARRRKNNPIVVGDPGVGKTAVVEGLALRITQGDVPDLLRDVRVMGLDMGLLEAGAGVKGEYENRLKGVISEIKASTKPIILFIDEAHTLVAAGGPAGSNNAANLLKPALARGELRTIAATTWSEYKKYFEKDAALARRFQLVKLDEPSVESTIGILRGLKSQYESVHKVIVRDDAIVAAAELSNRYIIGRQLPDKAVDLLDTSAARVKINLSTKPDSLEDKERRVLALVREQEGLERDLSNGQPVDEQRLKQIELERPALNTEIERLRERWEIEKAAAGKLIKARQALYEASLNGSGTADHAALKKQAEAAKEELTAAQGDMPLIRTEVDPDVIAKVVSDWTGVPLGKLLRDQARSVLSLADDLKKHVRGQDQGLDTIAEVIRSAKSGLKDPRQPMGVFLLVGPSGVGKTETAVAIADLLFGGEQAAVVLNMSEFQEKHTVSRLIGSPPGYVGYGEGGVLTEAVRQRPYSAVLLDEIEKADREVLNLFYQVFDKGTLSDGEGRVVDFSNTVIFLTSNLASDIITEACKDEERPTLESLVSSIRPLLNNYLKPALLARMTVVPYFALDSDALEEIARLKLEKLSKRLATSHGLHLNYSDAVVEQIAARCTEVETGARNIDFILNLNVLPDLSREILGRMSSGSALSTVRLDLADDKSFRITFEDEGETASEPESEKAIFAPAAK